jgi:hypothetical protein
VYGGWHKSRAIIMTLMMDNFKEYLVQSLKTELKSHYDDICDRIFTANNIFSKRLDELEENIYIILNQVERNSNILKPVFTLNIEQGSKDNGTANLNISGDINE